MKKMLLVFTLVVISLLFAGCGSKSPFEAKKPLPKAALVYVYVVDSLSMDEQANHSEYSILINGKRYLERIESGEYMVFNLKPNITLMSAVKSQIIEQHVKLNLKAGDINYLRITDNLGAGEFKLEQVDSSTGRLEIARTGLAGSNIEDPDNIITELIGEENHDDSIVGGKSAGVPQLTEAQIDAIIEKKLAGRAVSTPAPVQAPTQTYSTAPKVSKMDEIQRAFDMKNNGMLTQEEFSKIKAEILAK